eukprot:4337120-Pyramimonas_sp.AAC.1
MLEYMVLKLSGSSRKELGVTDMLCTLAQRDDVGVHGVEALGILQEGVRCYRYVTHPGAA